jgi:hypothetical protein
MPFCSPLPAPLRVIALASLLLMLADCDPSQTSASNQATSRGVAALALVPGQGATYNGFAKGVSGESAGSVVQRALASCNNAQCKVIYTWVTGDCLGIVKGEKHVWWQSRRTMGEALAKAMNECLAKDSQCELSQNMCL